MKEKEDISENKSLKSSLNVEGLREEWKFSGKNKSGVESESISDIFFP